MNFYFYVYLRSHKVTIHRAECSFCRQGKGVQRKIFKDANGFWDGPYPAYEAVFSQAFAKACELNVEPVNCKNCRPESLARSYSTGSGENCGDEPAEQQAATNQRNRLITLKQLDGQHATELQQFVNFYQHIRRLMQERHRAEQESAGTHSSGLGSRSIPIELQAQQVAELAEAQAVSYALLQEKQTKEREEFRQLQSITG